MQSGQHSTRLSLRVPAWSRRVQIATWWPKWPRKKSMRRRFAPWGGLMESPRLGRSKTEAPNRMPNQAVQRTGASRFAQRPIERHRRLAPVADLCVRRILLFVRTNATVRWSELEPPDEVSDVGQLDHRLDSIAASRSPDSPTIVEVRAHE